jgi:S-DNA-T family DNA segregation ATPase FtsK/SpoIIIE
VEPRRFQAFINMVKRPFLMMKPAKPYAIPELTASDARDLSILDELHEAVEALAKAEREAKNFKRSKNPLSSDGDLPFIMSVRLDDDMELDAEGASRQFAPAAQSSGSTPPDLVAVSIKPATVPVPPPGPLKGIPPPPRPRPPLVQPRITTGPNGLAAEQRHLGLTEPTPNQPLPEVPPFPQADGADRPDLPPHSLFGPPGGFVLHDVQALEATKELIQKKLAEFKVKGRVTGMRPGPVVTVYEFLPDPGIALAKVMNMEDDLALGLQAEKVRIDRVLDKNVVGIEVPNPEREIISFREILDSPEFKIAPKAGSQGLLSLVLGKDIGGKPIVANLAKMPHLLIGGNTGSGKSVGVNAMICSILLRARADEVKLIMVDPKIVELGIYEDIPHLWAPVVTDMKEAGRILKWVVAQMEERYKCLSMVSVRDLEQFNAKIIAVGGSIDISEKTPNPRWPNRPLQLEPLPYVVVVIDELADLMMVCKSEVEESIARIAQKARAVGIHLILATQRPSVDIITGVIKANLPGRLSYRVNTKIDSRTILDSAGGEQLLGNGDALFLAPGTSQKRIHGPWVTESEILLLVEWLKEKGRPDYNQALMQAMEADESDAGAHALGGDAVGSDIYERATEVVLRERKASTSLLQRKLGIGYGRAARLIDRMEEEGIIGPDRGAGKPREVLEQ